MPLSSKTTDDSTEVSTVNAIPDTCKKPPFSPTEDLPNIFKRSYTTRPEKGGQGLGLAITRAIIPEHGGRIEVSSSEGPEPFSQYGCLWRNFNFLAGKSNSQL